MLHPLNKAIFISGSQLGLNLQGFFFLKILAAVSKIWCIAGVERKFPCVQFSVETTVLQVQNGLGNCLVVSTDFAVKAITKVKINHE